MITLIAAMGKNREIGENNLLLWDLPKDMKHFRDHTKGKVVVMGRKTFESIGRPLPNRRNIVLTRDKNFSVEGVETKTDISEIFEIATNTDLMIIGGSQIYKLFLPYTDRLLLTIVDGEFVNADAFFPEIDFSHYDLISETHELKDENNNFNMVFQDWRKSAV